MNATNDYTSQYVQAGVELPFVVLHMAVAGCIVRQMRLRKELFRTCFFKLYVAESVSDASSYLMYLFAFRLIDLLPPVLRLNPGYAIMQFVAEYVELFSYTMHVAMAMNRFIILAKPAVERHFTRRRVTFLCILPPLPIALTAFVLPDCVSTDDKEECLRLTYTLNFFLFALFSGATSLTTISLDLCTFVSFKAQSKTKQWRGREDFRLLVYSMIQFAFTFAQCIMYVVITVGLWTRQSALADTAFSLTWYNMSFIALSPPICLIIMSKTVRRECFRMLTSMLKPNGKVTMVMPATYSDQSPTSGSRRL